MERKMARIAWVSTLLISVAGCAQVSDVLTYTPPATSTIQLQTTSVSDSEETSLPESTNTIVTPSEHIATPNYGEPLLGTEPDSLKCATNGAPKRPAADFGLKGTVLYRDVNNHEWYMVGGFPLSTSNPPIEAAQSIGLIGLSPAGDWLAFAPYLAEMRTTDTPSVIQPFGLRTPQLILLSSSGQRLEYSLGTDVRSYAHRSWLVYPPNWFTAVPGGNWVNDHVLRLSLNYHNFDDVYSRGLVVPRLFDLSTGKWLDDPIDSLSHRQVDGAVGFAPDMSRVLFLASSESGGSGFILRDRVQEQDVWSEYGDLYNDLASIRWASDSSAVALYRSGVYPDQPIIRVITRDGVVSSVPVTDWFRIGSLEWSPDSRRLGFVVYRHEVDEPEEIALYVRDVSTAATVLICPISGYDGRYLPDLAWAPDGRYIALSVSSDYEARSLQIVDVDSGEIIKLANDSRYVGWSEAFSVQWQPQP